MFHLQSIGAQAARVYLIVLFVSLTFTKVYLYCRAGSDLNVSVTSEVSLSTHLCYVVMFSVMHAHYSHAN